MKRLAELLTRTSRTFALSIRLLPAPLRQEVSIAYLLLRVADTLEDAALWTPQQRVVALAQLDVLIGVSGASAAEHDSARWAAALPVDHEGCLALVSELPALLDALGELEPTAQVTIVRHVRRTISGMIKFLTARGAPGNLALIDVQDLRRYCYVVAGIVGEMLSELLVEQGHVPRSLAVELWEKAAAFGEGLQLVNMLEDADEDAPQGLLPAGVDRTRLFALAHDDLDVAEAYVNTLRKCGASWGIVSFALLPIRLARATLHRVAVDGPGGKRTPSEVREHLQHVTLL